MTFYNCEVQRLRIAVTVTLVTALALGLPNFCRLPLGKQANDRQKPGTAVKGKKGAKGV
jgi:hypothetical protein